MSGTLTDHVLTFFQNEDFLEIRRYARCKPLLWSDFLGMKMPDAMSHKETWDVLTAIRRQTAVYFAVPYYNDERFVPAWYTLTHADYDALYRIEALCRAGSPLHSALAERSSRHFVIQPIIEEAIAAAEHDGLDIDYEDAREVLRGERNPRTAAERVIHNSHEVLCDLQTYAGQKITLKLIGEIHQRIRRGVATDHALCKPRPLPVVNPFGPDPADTLRFVCKLADGTAVSPGQHPVITAACIRYCFWDFQPLDYWNSMVGSVMSRLYLISMGYPALQYIPLSKALAAWEDGYLRPPTVLCTYEESRVDCGSSVDVTPHVSVILQMILSEIAVLERAINVMQVRDDYLRSMLNDDSTINYRQRAVLDQALRTPDREFTISVHRKAHNVVYATARADLLGLVDHGFFRKEQRDRAFVFWACPDLRTLIEEYVPQRQDRSTD